MGQTCLLGHTLIHFSLPRFRHTLGLAKAFLVVSGTLFFKCGCLKKFEFKGDRVGNSCFKVRQRSRTSFRYLDLWVLLQQLKNIWVEDPCVTVNSQIDLSKRWSVGVLREGEEEAKLRSHGLAFHVFRHFWENDNEPPKVFENIVQSQNNVRMQRKLRNVVHYIDGRYMEEKTFLILHNFNNCGGRKKRVLVN